MTAILTVKASTTNEALESAIPFLDMREHAQEARDTAAAVIEEQGDQDVLEYHDIGGVSVLISPVFGYAYVNELSAGVGNSLVLENGEADDAEHAASVWREGNA